MTRRGASYSCWLFALLGVVGTVALGALAIGAAVSLVGGGKVDLLELAFCAFGSVALGFFCCWWAGCEVVVEGGYVAWRSLLRRRRIRLDRVTKVTASGGFSATMTIDTDDGGRLHVLVPTGYNDSAESFAAFFGFTPTFRPLPERRPLHRGDLDVSDNDDADRDSPS